MTCAIFLTREIENELFTKSPEELEKKGLEFLNEFYKDGPHKYEKEIDFIVSVALELRFGVSKRMSGPGVSFNLRAQELFVKAEVIKNYLELRNHLGGKEV